MKQEIYCVYHSADLDGKASGAIVLRRFPDAIMVPFDYDDEINLEQFRGHKVYMVDVSLQPFSRMVELSNMCELTWIDHHKTAIRDFNNTRKDTHPSMMVSLSTEFAACELTWQWMYSSENNRMPKAVHLLGRYDVWDHSNEAVLPFQYGMRVAPRDPEDPIWNKLFNPDTVNDVFPQIMETGETILEYQTSQNEKTAEGAFKVWFEGHNCIAVNAPNTGSKVFDSVPGVKSYDFMIVFHRGKKRWKYSLYEDKGEVDVGAIARRYGGGGHEGAGGFYSDTNILNK